MVQANSALSNDVKLGSLSETITRRLRNTSLELDLSRRLEILEDACVKMKTSGHVYKGGSEQGNQELQGEGQEEYAS